MIIIVGASRGIGKALTEVLFDKKLLLISRSKMEVNYNNHQHISLDINKINSQKLNDVLKIEKIEAIFFPVGVVNANDSLKLSDEEKDEIINTNLLSVIKFNEYLLNSKKINRDCLICFFSSASTILPRNKQMLYCASKNALNSYYHSLKNYLYNNKPNIRLAILILGYVDTSMNKNIKTIFPKKNPKEIAIFLRKKMNILEGIYYIPFYWFFIKFFLNFIPANIKIKLTNLLKV